MSDPGGSDGSPVRLHVVTGKGGAGKSTAAAALALALAAGGGRVLLCEVEGRQGIAQLFDCPPLPYTERKVALAPGGGEVYALAVDAEEALLDYLETFYRIRRGGVSARALRRTGAIDFATTVAPGMRDVLLTGKVKEAVDRRQGGRSRPGHHGYDAVVLDAPPTGRISRFLNVNAEVAGLARVGPIHGHADSVMRTIRSARTRVHLVTLLEAMPVQETIDGVAALREVDLPVGAVLITMVRAPLLPASARAAALAGRLDRDELRAGMVRARIPAGDDLVAALATETIEHAHRLDLEDTHRSALATLGLPTYELPLLPDTVDLAGLYALAMQLREQGAV